MRLTIKNAVVGREVYIKYDRAYGLTGDSPITLVDWDLLTLTATVEQDGDTFKFIPIDDLFHEELYHVYQGGKLIGMLPEDCSLSDVLGVADGWGNLVRVVPNRTGAVFDIGEGRDFIHLMHDDEYGDHAWKIN